MDKTCKIALITFRRRTAVILLAGIFLVTIFACATVYNDERMQPLAATAGDLARAVMRFSNNNPAQAALLDDQELVRQATAYDPKLLEPYKDFVVRGTADGVILVCTGDGRRALLEDAECSDKVDRQLWSDNDAPCQFTIELETVCP